MSMLESAARGEKTGKAEHETIVEALRVALVNAQFDLARADFPVIVLLAGDDRLAVESVLLAMGEWMDERNIRTEAFAPASEEERERPRFWRYWRALPVKGQLGVMLGAWAQGTVSAHLRGDLKDEALDQWVAHDVGFERGLIDSGALLLKFWLHVPRKALKRRLKEAEKSPAKHWYVDERDWEMYQIHDQVVSVLDDYLHRTDNPDAPWNVIDTTESEGAGVLFGQILLAGIAERLGEPMPVRSSPGVSTIAGRQSVLDQVDLTRSISKGKYETQLDKYSARLKQLSRKAADERVTTVLAFEGWDAAGKGGAIRRLKQALDPRISRIMSVAAPTEVEQDYPYLWRFWRHLPRAGSTLIFDRSWYGRVLVERVEGLASVADWSRAYEEICDFEMQLAEHGYLVQKFWLHIDPDEQLSRFEAREQTPYKKYKITEEDYRNRARWDGYAQAVDDMVRFTNTDHAPWHLISANDKRWARIEVLRTVCEGLSERLDV